MKKEDGDTQDKYATICKHYLTSVPAMFDSLLFLVGVPVIAMRGEAPSSFYCNKLQRR